MSKSEKIAVTEYARKLTAFRFAEKIEVVYNFGVGYMVKVGNGRYLTRAEAGKIVRGLTKRADDFNSVSSAHHY